MLIGINDNACVLDAACEHQCDKGAGDINVQSHPAGPLISGLNLRQPPSPPPSTEQNFQPSANTGSIRVITAFRPSKGGKIS